MILLPGAAKVSKNAFADRTAILGGQSRGSGFAIAFVSCRLPVCSGLLASSAFAGPARSFFVDPLYVKVSTDFLCFCLSQTIFFCFLSVLQLLQTLRITKRFYLLPLSKGLGSKREGEPPSLFCVFGSFCHITKGTSFSLSLGKGMLLLPLGGDAGSFLLTIAGGQWYFSSAQEKGTLLCKYTKSTLCGSHSDP